MAENKKQDRRRKKQNIQSDIVDNEKKNLRNKETNIIAFFFVGLFLATIVYLCIFNVRDAGTIVNNPYNKRVDNQESKVVRGDILADDGDVLATTLTDEDGNETNAIDNGDVLSFGWIYFSYRDEDRNRTVSELFSFK